MNIPALGPPNVAAFAPPASPATMPFPRPMAAGRDEGAIAQRAVRFCAGTRLGLPVLVPSEMVSALLVDLPKTSARRRAAMLVYAVEDRIGQPIELATVAAGPLRTGQPGQPGPTLALIAATATLASLGEGSKMPDFLLIHRPAQPLAGQAWAVWRDGTRALVRVSDGTGFAIGIDMLPMVWALAGKPHLISLGSALPAGLPFDDLSAAPPDPDPVDLTFRFAQPQSTGTTFDRLRPLIAVGAMLTLACLAHIGLTISDNLALSRINAAERAQVQAMLDPILPGVALTADVGPVLARLVPRSNATGTGPFLPLLAKVMEALALSSSPVTVRSLAWGQDDMTLVMTLQSAQLDDLQAVQQQLESAGLVVTAGAATASDGMAEVDVSIREGAD